MDSEVGKIVLPGDVIFDFSSVDSETVVEKILFGPGIRRDAGKMIATKCGIVRSHNAKSFYVDNHQKRYVPVRREAVIGVVLKKNVDAASVDIGSSQPANLSLFAFEGATKRNKPPIKVGDLVYAKIIVACKDMEPELVCVDSYGRCQELGILSDGGFMFNVPLEVSRRLLSPKMKLLKSLSISSGWIFEVTVGMNGRVWVKGNTLQQTLAIVQAISMIENATEDQAIQMFNNMFECVMLS